jgi:hypothetical protein
MFAGATARTGRRLYSCHRGVVAVAADTDLIGAVDKQQNWLIRSSPGLRLMPPAASDQLLPYQIRLAFELEEHDLGCIAYDAPEAIAATTFGPPQDKDSNQDFCLSGTIDDVSGRTLAFAAVADGVSIGSFWSQRGAQIACFSAFSALKQLWCGGLAEVPRMTAAHVAEFRRLCAETAAKWIKADRSDLLYDFHGVPPDWNPVAYQRTSHVEKRWHNCTLLVTAVSESGGLVCWSGDGGIAVARRRPGGEWRYDTPLVSPDESALEQCVSPEVNEADLQAGVIDVAGYEYVEVISCTDGVDRTLQQAGVPLWDFAGSLCSSRELSAELEGLPERYGDKAAPDNYALARIAWPFLETRAAVSPAEPEHTDGPEAEDLRRLAEKRPCPDIGRKPEVP